MDNPRIAFVAFEGGGDRGEFDFGAGFPTRLTGAATYSNHDARKNPDDRDDGQEFDQGKGTGWIPTGHGWRQQKRRPRRKWNLRGTGVN